VYNDIHTTAGFVGRQLDVLLIGYFRGATEVGYYKLARNLAGATGYAVGPLTTVAYADLTRHWSAGEVARFWHKVRRLAWQVGLPLGLAIGLGVLVLPEILTLLVGPAYTPAITVARILLAASACEAAFFWVHLTYMATGHIGTFLSISGSFTVVLGLTWLVVVPLFGYVGMAAAVLAVGAAQTAVSVALLPRLGARDELQGVIGRNGESATSVMS
jgi:O-antigen/teichoic acid export membrane protein